MGEAGGEDGRRRQDGLGDSLPVSIGLTRLALCLSWPGRRRRRRAGQQRGRRPRAEAFAQRRAPFAPPLPRPLRLATLSRPARDGALARRFKPALPVPSLGITRLLLTQTTSPLPRSAAHAFAARRPLNKGC